MSEKTLHLIRHAQGYHNLSLESHGIRDPLLTPLGLQQCLTLSQEFPNIQNVDCIIASPMRRTLQTALNTFHAVLAAKPGLKIIALPHLQETSTMPCDVGTSPSTLIQEFAGKPIDFFLVTDGWNDKIEGPYAPRADLVARRVWKARKFLQGREEKNIAVVTHGGLLHYLTEDWVGSSSGVGTGWSNCEHRTYTFDTSSRSSIISATIAETQDSVARRIGHTMPLSCDEQLELQSVAESSWAADGYITLPTAGTTLEYEQDDMLDVCTESRTHESRGPIGIRSVL
ncbi:phosphoglycerate mutase-like protein [Amniculicola lignicola CBS 123094]|uniref:Phosphoglycerate mutase-like protein n=1 Tax=Amniculicola lignicola CBS 123094 TaxID=1392246 RepID=A0A6A5W9C9_9PLEO|nr:phosphoglycerate mutase-like protein [Amniculicola lignicola CBS 123094]